MLGRIASEFRVVVMDTEIDDAIYLYGNNEKYLRFGRKTNNLYCMELRSNEENGEYFFGTVKGKMAKFLKIDCKPAEAIADL